MGRRIAITGAAGQLGQQLVQVFEAVGDTVLALARPEFDITRPADLQGLSDWAPQVVVNAAAWTDVDGCARDPVRAMFVNGASAGAVAKASARVSALTIQISTNEVFDGTLDRPYVEADEPHPVNAYGASKLAGERSVIAANPRNVIVRTAWLFAPRGKSFVTKIMDAAERAEKLDQPLRVVQDEWGNPTWVPDLAVEIEQLTRLPNPVGVLHLCGVPATSRYAWAREILAGRSVRVVPTTLQAYDRPSRPPRRAVLDTQRAAQSGLGPLLWRPHLPEVRSMRQPARP